MELQDVRDCFASLAMTSYIASIFRKHATKVKTRVKTKMKTKMKNSDLILDLIKVNPSISREEMPKALNLTIDGIDWNIRKLKNEGKHKRIGPDRGGYWEVVE